jgi:hypothetical protein
MQYLMPDEIDVFAVPVFVYVMKEEEQKTAVKFKLSWAAYGTDTTPSRYAPEPEVRCSPQRGPVVGQRGAHTSHAWP